MKLIHSLSLGILLLGGCSIADVGNSFKGERYLSTHQYEEGAYSFQEKVRGEPGDIEQPKISSTWLTSLPANLISGYPLEIARSPNWKARTSLEKLSFMEEIKNFSIQPKKNN